MNNEEKELEKKNWVENFTNNLESLRKERGWTQSKLANLVSTSIACINHYEAGQRQPNSIALTRLAKCFNVSTDYLCGLTNEQDGLNTSHDLESFVNTFKSLSRKDRQRTLSIMESLLEVENSDL